MADTYSTIGPQCPYCGAVETADDPGYYAPDYDRDICMGCGKEFAVEHSVTHSWVCEEIENDDEPELPFGGPADG